VSAAPRRATPRRERVGVLGGTFDPPHTGHLALAEWARVDLALDRVLFVPAGRPPHKRRAVTDARHRLAMTRLAVRGNPAFEVLDLETRRTGPSYTSDTLRELARRMPRAELHLILGADMFATLDSWHEAGEVRRLATLVVALRPGSPRPARAGRARGVVWLDNPGLEVSSSALRDRARTGTWRYLVPDAVIRYAERHGLYRPGATTRPRRGA
jgi:nicotinate-nucleotide adenylyltransferase